MDKIQELINNNYLVLMAFEMALESNDVPENEIDIVKAKVELIKSHIKDIKQLEQPKHKTLEEVITSHLSDTYCCTRVWEAWEYGTMTQDDFVLLEETNIISDIIEELKTKGW